MKILEDLKSLFKKFLEKPPDLLMHPTHTFTIMIAGVMAISGSQDEFAILFGHDFGAKLYVISNWAGKICMAMAAAGRSILTTVDKPKGDV